MLAGDDHFAPLRTRAFPMRSTTTQKLFVGHDTELRG
jgi:hypothetical protein